jgi:ferredoxin-NADP reductase
MSSVTNRQHDHDFVAVKCAHSCDSMPGQCVTVDGKYFAIAENDGSVLTLLGKNGGALDVEVGAELNIQGPFGPGFKSIDCEHAVIITGGTGIGACISVLKHRASLGLKTAVVSYARQDHPFTGVLQEHGGVCWNTTTSGRPESPFSPLGVSEFPPGTVVFTAGPRELVESIKRSAEKFNISSDNISLNY